MSKELIPPFRADVVGSYLRPDYLHQARRQFASGEIDQAALTRVEDRAIRELVEQQKAAGLKVITDGEFRRSWWHLDFMWGLGGVEKTALEQGYHFSGTQTRAESCRLTGRISGDHHPFIEHFRFLAALAEPSLVPRLTIPAPAQFLRELQRPANRAHTDAIYPDQQALLDDIAAAYRTVIRDVYAAGCRNLQLDDCTWGMLTDPKVTANTTGCGCGSQHGDVPHSEQIRPLLETLLSVNNAALADAPADLVLTTHICRGNYRSTWAASGGYGPVADVVFARSQVDAFYLEFDTERAGDFAPLAQLAKGKKVVLGLVSSKVPELESADAIIERIHEASRVVPLEQLYLSTQCGFASTEEGNALSEAQQWAKIALVTEVAKRVWGE